MREPLCSYGRSECRSFDQNRSGANRCKEVVGKALGQLGDPNIAGVDDHILRTQPGPLMLVGDHLVPKLVASVVPLDHLEGVDQFVLEEEGEG